MTLRAALWATLRHLQSGQRDRPGLFSRRCTLLGPGDLGSLLRRMTEVGLRTTDVVEFRLAGAPVNGLLFDVDAVRFHVVSPARHRRLPHLKNIARISTLERKRGSGLRISVSR